MTRPKCSPRAAGVPEMNSLSAASSSDVSRALSAYAALPDIRADKVREMRHRLATGTFRPSAEALAEAILKSTTV